MPKTARLVVLLLTLADSAEPLPDAEISEISALTGTATDAELARAMLLFVRFSVTAKVKTREALRLAMARKCR